MKKYLLLILLLLLMCSCDNRKNDKIIDESLIISKTDANKGYVFFNDFTSYNLGNEQILEQKIPIINCETADAKKVNLELKSRVAINNKKALVVDGITSKVLFDECEVVENEKSVSLIIREYNYMNNEKSIAEVLVYVFNKKNMMLYSKNDLLNNYNLTQDDLYNRLEEKLGQDSLYYLMMIKNGGYELYIDDNSDLVLLSVINSDDESELKKVVITN